jgi:glyoxylase-like metal-dependent hydrolase (beta-lactamase superfamily II)
MRNSAFLGPILSTALMAAISSAHAATLQSASDALSAGNTKSIEISGIGHWYQFGQAPSPNLPWPQFDVSSYIADIDFDTASERVQITRKQTVEPKRERPPPVQQKVDQYVSGTYSWNLNPPAAAAAPGSLPVATAQPAALAERDAEIWATPQGFLKAAQANHAVSKTVNGGAEVSFTVYGKYRFVGLINAQNQVERIKTWIDTPVLGDTLIETRFSGYKDFSGIQFPSHIARSEGGYPVLDIDVTSVSVNPVAGIAVPNEILNAKAPVVTVEADKIAEGVYYLTGGTHHSVAIEQRDHIVIVEAPLNEERSLVVIAKVKEIIPGKPIKFLINTHAHFDHSGGLRTFVDAGTTIVTHEDNKAYYQKVWSAPRTINPDHLASSAKVARFETFKDKHVLTDGKRTIEIYSIKGNGHNDAFALVYLPAEKILVEADAYTPGPANAAPSPAVNPYTVNLYTNIQKLKLDVEQIAPLHGRLTSLAELRTSIGEGVAAK